MKTMKEKNITYSIVYADDFVEYAQDGSCDYKTYKEAKSRLSDMEDKEELTIIRISDNGEPPHLIQSTMFYREGTKWIEL